MSIGDAVQRWLPVPTYRFIGGPLDGQQRTVKLIKTRDGMAAPAVWAHDGFPEAAPVRWSTPAAIAPTVTVRRHFYRFEPDRGSINAGVYRLIAEARS